MALFYAPPADLTTAGPEPLPRRGGTFILKRIMAHTDWDRLHALAKKTGRTLPEGVRIRPPAENRSVLIRATRGCAWNTCRYCNLYRESATGVRPLADIQDDLALAHALYGDVSETLFFGDADILAMPPADAPALMRTARERFARVTRVSAYATPTSALDWTDAELEALAAAGLQRLYAGLDTNAATLHTLVRRPGTPAQMQEGLQRLKTAGFELWVGVILGLGGADYSAEHMAETAECLNAIAPHVISIRTLACGEHQPLTEPIWEGRLELAWADADPSPIQQPVGTLDELRDLVTRLDCRTEIVCDHASNFMPEVRGHLPAHREALFDAINMAETHLKSLKRPVPIRIFV